MPAVDAYDRRTVEIVFWILGALVVFAVAAVAVGRVTANLAHDPERAVFDAGQSVEFVAEALPSEVTAELSYDDVTAILHLFHDYMHERGVATTAGEDDLTDGPQVVDPEEGTAWVIRHAAASGVTYRRSDVAAVIEAQLAYFAAIGVVGDEVESPDDLDIEPGPDLDEQGDGGSSGGGRRP